MLKNSIVILGAPCSGKGTQARILSKKYQFNHIIMSDILREEIYKKTDLGMKIDLHIRNGQLLSDEIVCDLLNSHVRSIDNNIVFDGMPRTLEQARFLSKIANITAVISLKIDFNILAERVKKRVVCGKCSASYEGGNICECGGNLINRFDDSVEILKKRVNSYIFSIDNILKFYNDQKILHEIDGNQEIDQITKEISDILDNI